MRLLLTVTEAGEVGTALAAGADLVDVKDPGRGSLGAPSPEVLHRVARRLDGRVPLSVPLGDGPHEPGAAARRARAAAELGAAYVKVGLLAPGPAGGAGSPGDGPGGGPRSASAPAVLEAARRALDRAGGGASLVAVGFADVPPGRGPGPGELLDVASAAGAAGVMLDTLGKCGPSAPDLLGRGRLGRWVRAARRRGLEAGLAGGLDAAAIRSLGGLPLDVVGVRGGACAGGREGRLDPERCRAVRRAVDAAAAGEAGAGGTASAGREPAVDPAAPGAGGVPG